MSSFLKRAAVVAVGTAFAFISLMAGAVDYPLSDGGDIAAALDAASGGDTITLGTGTYKLHDLVVGKAVTIRAAAEAVATLDLQSQAGGMTLSVDGAVLKGCKLVNCRQNAVVINAAGAKMLDCELSGYNGSGSPNVNLSAGLVSGCVFREFSGGYAYDNYIVKVTGGTFADSVIEDCSVQFDWMLRVNGDAAVMTNVVIRNSLLTGKRGGDNVQDGVLRLDKGLVTHCIISNSGCQAHSPGGTVLVCGGTLRNSLVADCKGATYPGVQMTSGRLENCTIANNGGDAGKISAFSLKMTGGTAVNNVFADEISGMKSVIVSGGTFVTNLVPVDVGVGVGNLTGRPSFVSPATGNYAPGFASPAVDSADWLGWITDDAIDLVGQKRIKGAGPDMGAYEGPYGDTEPLACKATIENNLFRSDSEENTVTFTATSVGVGAATATYAWYVDGSATAAGTGKVFAYDGFTAGRHTVKLVATPADTSLAPAELTMTDCVLVYPPTVYVDSACEHPEAPYATWNHAAATLGDALDFLMAGNAYLPSYGNDADDLVTVEVRDGTYVLGSRTFGLPIRLVASSGSRPEINLQKSVPGMSFTHAANVFDGFTILGASKYAVQLYNGAVMRNCSVIDSCNAQPGSSDAVVMLSPGVVSNCLFRGATSDYAFNSSAMKLTGASLACDCLFEGFNNYDSAIYVAGEDSVLSNCVIRNCPMGQCGDQVCYNIITLTAGLVTHCIVTNCGNASYTGVKEGGVVYVRGDKAEIRNCLLLDNKAKTKAGICLSKGKVENCTVVGGEVKAGSSQEECQLKQSGGDVANVIFWHGAGNTCVTSTGGTLTNNLVGIDPLFVRPDKNDYRLRAGSPAVNKGIWRDWMSGATDLAGCPRVFGKKPDIGCYECQIGGFTLIVR